MEERTKFHVGLDVHKDSISVAAAELGRRPARLIGKVAHDVNKLLKVLARIGSAEQLRLVYEAGPTGFGLQRALKAISGSSALDVTPAPAIERRQDFVVASVQTLAFKMRLLTIGLEARTIASMYPEPHHGHQDE